MKACKKVRDNPTNKLFEEPAINVINNIQNKLRLYNCVQLFTSCFEIKTYFSVCSSLSLHAVSQVQCKNVPSAVVVQVHHHRSALNT